MIRDFFFRLTLIFSDILMDFWCLSIKMALLRKPTSKYFQSSEILYPTEGTVHTCVGCGGKDRMYDDTCPEGFLSG